MTNSHRIAGEWWLLPSFHQEHVGYRYMIVVRHEEKLTLRQRVRLHEEFADEFDRLPPSREPSEGWAKYMAEACRTAVQRLRERIMVEEPVANLARERQIPQIPLP